MPSRRVLIIEDDRDMVWMVEKFLRGVGFETVSAGKGEDAHELALRHRPQIVLLDVRLPKMNGYEVCRRLKSSPDTAGITVVFVTAVDKEEVLREGGRVGGDFFIAKPFKANDLAVDLYHLFDKRLRGGPVDPANLRVSAIIPVVERPQAVVEEPPPPPQPERKPETRPAEKPVSPRKYSTREERPVGPRVSDELDQALDEVTRTTKGDLPEHSLGFELTSDGQFREASPFAMDEENQKFVKVGQEILREMIIFKQSVELISNRLNAIEKQIQQLMRNMRY